MNQTFFVTKQHGRQGGAGFTLVEMMLAIFIFTMVSLGLVTIMSNLFSFSGKQSGLLSDQDQARLLVGQVVYQLRNAQTGSDGSYALSEAGDQEIIFFSTAGSQPGVQRIRYFLQNGALWQGLTTYSGGVYNTSTEQTLLVQNDVANSPSQPIFYYYDGDYSGTSTQSSLTQPINVTQVKFVKVNLLIANKAGVANNSLYAVVAGAAIRSLKTNLGK